MLTVLSPFLQAYTSIQKH